MVDACMDDYIYILAPIGNFQKAMQISWMEEWRVSCIHTDDGVVQVAGNMEPRAGIGEGWIPALQHVVWILPC